MLDLHTREFGYTEMAPPYLVREETAYGTGQSAESGRGHVPDHRSIWRNVADPDRRDAADQSRRRRDPRRGGAAAALYGLDAVLPLRGRRRGPRHARDDPRHISSNKVELVSIAKPEDSAAEHERMTACAEEVLKRLGLAYRVMLLSSGDMGFAAREDLRHRGLAAGAERLSRDFELLELRGVPGPPHEGALSPRWREGHAASCTRSTDPGSRSAAR